MSRFTDTLKQNQLLLITLAMISGYGWIGWRFPLRPLYRERLADIRTFTPTLNGGLMYAAVILLLFVLCWRMYQLTRTKPLTRRTILGTTFLMGLPLLLTYPINANDLFRYVIRGRVMAIYGQNPYLQPPSAFPNDPLAHLAGEWANKTSPYGPIWELVDALIGLVSGDNLLLALIIFKLLGLLLMIATGWFIYAITPKRAVLWCWNPALFLMFVVDAHNDALMLLWLVVALWWVQHRPISWRNATISTLIALLSPLTKLTGIVFLPFLGVSLLRRLPDRNARLAYLGAATAGSLLLTWAAFLPFGNPRLLAVRLFAETQNGGAFSPLAFLYFVDQRVDAFRFSIGNWVERASLLFVVVALGMVVVAIFGRNPLRAVADTYVAYLVTAFNYRIWYALWVFPWVLLDETSEWRLRAGYLFLITSQLSVVLYGHIRAFWLDGSAERAHLWGIPFVFALPIVIALSWKRWSAWQTA